MYYIKIQLKQIYLEEGSLLRTHASVLSWNCDINGSNGPGLGGSCLLVGQEQVSDNGQLLLGEDESNVHLDVRKKLLKVGVLLQVSPDDLPHHGVLAHEDDGLASQGNPDLLHLFGSNIVGSDDEALGIFVQKLLELGEVVSFPGGFALPNHFDRLRNSFKDSEIYFINYCTFKSFTSHKFNKM